MNEVLSLHNMLNGGHLMWIWGTADAVMGIFVIFRLIGKQREKCELMQMIKRNPVLILFFVTFGTMIAISLLTVPYNWDSMSYHLARIAHWKQNASVAHYTTGELRQLTSPVLGEFVNLQVYIFWGKWNDSALNLLQTFSYVFNTVLIYGIGKKTGLSLKNCFIAMVLYISMPIAYAEALSTQVDEFATVWLLMFVYLALDFTDRKLEWNWKGVAEVFAIACTMPFGYLTKPSVLPGMLLMGVWILVANLRKKCNVRIIVPYMFCIVLISIILISPEVYRNIITFHAISSPQAGARQIVGTLNPFYLLINFMKNIADNLTNIYVYNGGAIISKGVFKMASILGVDINSPAIAEDGLEYIINTPQNYSHDSAGNPVIVISFLVLLLLFIFRRKKSQKGKIDQYFIYAGLAFILFACIVRWEPYTSRYMLSYMALLCPAVAGQIQHIENQSQMKYYIAVGFLYFFCVVDLYGLTNYHAEICYKQHQRARRSDGYFYYNEDAISSYNGLADAVIVGKYRTVGLEVPGGSYEYPIWAMLQNTHIQIESVLEEANVSSVYENSLFVPDCIIIIGQGEKAELMYHGTSYHVYQKISDDTFILTHE